MIIIEVNDHTPIFDDDPFKPNGVVRWDLPSGSILGTVVATDNDANPNSGSVEYTLTKSQYQLLNDVADGFDYLIINSTSGEISNIVDFAELYDMFKFSSFVVSISASDQGAIPKSSETTITITPFSVPVLPNSLATINVPENTRIDSTVFSQFDCSEIGPSSGTLVLELSSTNNGPFVINQDTLGLAVAREIDFETISDPTFVLTVTCSNIHQLQDTVTFQVEIENLDEYDFKFEMPSYSIEIPEDTPNSAVIITLKAVDLDTPATQVEYSFIDNVQDFHIHQFNGEIRTTARGLDRERTDQYTLQVRAVLSTLGINIGGVATTNVTVTIGDINDNPPYFVESDVYIDEVLSNIEIGDSVLTVLALDDDIGSNGEINYSLEENVYFAINETTGVVYVSSPSSLVPMTTIILTVVATDNGPVPMNASGTIVVYVRPSPDRLVFSESSYIFNVAENNARGYAVGVVNADIVNVLNSTFNESSEHRVEYEIINGTSTSIFVISRQDGELFLLTSLDYERVQEYDLTIRASLSSHDNITKDVLVRVMVVNSNDNAPIFSAGFYTTVVSELTPSSRSLLQVSAVDIDNTLDSNITFRLDGSADSEIFEIDSQSGVITADQTLRTIRDYRFNVIASDGELESESVVFISVSRSSSVSLTFTKEKYIFNISENILSGSYIGTVMALTNGSLSSQLFPDLGFRIYQPDMPNTNNSNTTGSLFHIDPVSGNISTLSITDFDAESQQLFVFYVEVFDDVTVYDSAVIEVQLTDENDNEPVFFQSLYSRVIDTSQTVNSVILTVSAQDRDFETRNNEIDYIILSGPLGFALQAGTGNLTVTNSTLIPGEYYLTIVATDNGMPALNSTAVVYVAIVPSIPTRIEFNESTYYFTIPENAELATLVGMVAAFDSNPNITSTIESIRYSTPNITRCFTLDEMSGELRVSCDLDRETMPRVELQLLATISTQNGDIIGYSRIIIDILDINDNKPEFSLNVYVTAITDNHGDDDVIQVVAMDTDIGNNSVIVYSLTDPEGVAVNATNYFEIDNSTGIITLSGPSIDIGDYRLIAVATDSGMSMQLSSTAVVLICVTRSQPSQITFVTRSFRIAENSPVDTPVGTVQLTSGSTGLSILPEEFSNNLVFRITGGDSSSFRIDSVTGNISTTVSLDREFAASHAINVEADFMAFGISQAVGITIIVTDENDVIPSFMPSIHSTVIDDNEMTGNVILEVKTIDNDESDNARVSFAILDPDDNLPFDVEFTSFNPPYTRGQIIISNDSNLIPAFYQFQIIGMDNGNPSLNNTAIVSITVNHALPEEIYFPTLEYHFNFTETRELEHFVGNVSVSQMTPSLNELIYQITGGNNGFFHLNPNSGVLTNVRTIDREANPSFAISIRAILFNTSLVAETMVTVTILDVNDNRPIFTNSGSYSVMLFTNEVTTVTSLIDVLATDIDEGRNAKIRYNITAGNDLGLFRIDQNGRIFPTVAPLNASTHILTVTAEDSGENIIMSNTATVTIVIQNAIPESIQFVQPEGYNFTVDENSNFLQSIGQVSIEPFQPADLVPFLEFSISPNTFLISAQGNIRSAGNLDFEQAQNHTLNVTATLEIPIERFSPQVTLVATVQVIIFVIDLNDNDPMFIDFPVTIEHLEERGSEEMIGSVAATDADSGSNQELVYMLLNTDSDVTGQFRVDSNTGDLYAAAGIDRELQESYTLIIRVCDSGTSQNCITENINYVLIDINDNVPRVTSGTEYEVRERVPADTLVFNIVASDPDADYNGQNSLRYLFPNFAVIGSSGTSYGTRGGNVFRINEQTGEVFLRMELDYETETFYTTTIRVRDRYFNTPTTSGSLRSDTSIKIRVINEADNDPLFTLPSNQDSYLIESVPMVTRDDTLATVVATDNDPEDQLSFSIVSILEEGNNGVEPLFAIDQVTGRVYMRDDQTFTPEAVFTINIVVFDNSQFNLTDSVLLIVTVLPEQLLFEESEYTIEISESVDAGSELTRLLIRELSVSSEITYVLDVTSPVDEGAAFSIPGGSSPEAVISLASGQGLDRENIPQYQMTITAQRQFPVPQTATATLVINVLDINDNTPRFIDGENPVIRVNEETLSQTKVSRVNVTDRDINENGRIQYDIIDEPLAFPFFLNPDTGDLVVIGDIDYEMVQSFNMTVRARDSATTNQLSSIQTYFIVINNINDNFPQFSAVAYFGEVFSEANQGDIVHNVILMVSDPDDVNNEQDLTFEITFSDPSSPDARAGYVFEVTDTAPYQIRVVSLPEIIITQPKLLFLEVKVADEGGISATVPLYIYLLISENFITFNLRGISNNEFINCTNNDHSVCNFLDLFGRLVTQELSQRDSVFFADHSVEVLDVDT